MTPSWPVLEILAWFAVANVGALAVVVLLFCAVRRLDRGGK